MSKPHWTLDNFKSAGRGHLHSAARVLEHLPTSGVPEPARTLTSAAYLAHVALECAIKARLLSRGGYACAEDLAEKNPSVHATLFRSPQGHRLDELARHVRLRAFVEACGKTWSDDDCWKRMTSSDRPYSLRYGAEKVERRTVEAEVRRATTLLVLLLDGLKIVPLRTHRPRTR